MSAMYSVALIAVMIIRVRKIHLLPLGLQPYLSQSHRDLDDVRLRGPASRFVRG